MGQRSELFIKMFLGFMLCSLGTVLILMEKRYIITYIASAFILLIGILVIVFAIAKFAKCLCYESIQNDNDNNNNEFNIEIDTN